MTGAQIAAAARTQRSVLPGVSGKDRVYEATSFPSVLSLPTLMKELVPRLAAAVDGDPSTSTDQT